MDRKDFYYRQKVTEGELDEAFDAAENADHNLMVDQSLVGLLSGNVTEKSTTPDISVDVSATVGYDQEGQRINIPSSENVDVSEDYTSTSTSVAGSGNEKIVSLFVEFERSLSDPRVDGNSQTVFFDRDESYAYFVKQGAESSPPATPPALEADKLLLADITRSYGQTQIFDADINAISRRQNMIGNRYSGEVVVCVTYTGDVKLGTYEKPFTSLSSAATYIAAQMAATGRDEWSIKFIGPESTDYSSFAIPSGVRHLRIQGNGRHQTKLAGPISWSVDDTEERTLEFVDLEFNHTLTISGSIGVQDHKLIFERASSIATAPLSLSGITTSGGKIQMFVKGDLFSTLSQEGLEFQGHKNSGDQSKIEIEAWGVEFMANQYADSFQLFGCDLKAFDFYANSLSRIRECWLAGGFSFIFGSSQTLGVDAFTNWWLKNVSVTLTNVTKVIYGDTTA